jgi:hypothetical protein
LKRTIANGREVQGVGSLDSLARLAIGRMRDFPNGLTVYSDNVTACAVQLLRDRSLNPQIQYTGSGVSSVRIGRVILRDYRRWGSSPAEALKNADHVEDELGSVGGTPGAVAASLVRGSVLFRTASDRSYGAASPSTHGGFMVSARGHYSARSEDASQGVAWLPDFPAPVSYAQMKCVDIRSAYALAMSGPLPIEGTEDHSLTKRNVARAIETGGYLTGEFSTGWGRLPVSQHGDFGFRSGVVYGTFPGISIRRCLEMGGKIKKVSACTSYVFASHLRAPMDRLLGLRDKTGRKIWKAIANHTYGRLLGYSLAYTVRQGPQPLAASTIWESAGYTCAISPPAYRGNLCSPAAGVWVSATVAARSMDTIADLQAHGWEVVYWDTDGGIVGHASASADLGLDRAWKVRSLRSATVIAKKQYRCTYDDGEIKTVLGGAPEAYKDRIFDMGSCILSRNQSLPEALESSDPFVQRLDTFDLRIHGSRTRS